MFDAEIISKELLSEMFNASMIWGFIYQLRNVIRGMEAEKKEALANRNTPAAGELERKLLYVYDNLMNLEDILNEKELDLYTLSPFGKIYNN